MRITIWMVGGERHTAEVAAPAWDALRTRMERGMEADPQGLAWQQQGWLLCEEADTGWPYWLNMAAVQRIGPV